jgi:8-hydroxy-5-deazaflavin:NADPH oxidoreductase
MNVGIIGHGNVGSKLAALLAAAKHTVVVGTRKVQRGATSQGTQFGSVSQAIASAEVIIIAIPYAACAEALRFHQHQFAGKVVIDATNPLLEDWSPLLLGEENSAGEEIARLLPEAQIVKAFNTVFADIMLPERLRRLAVPATAFIAGDHAAANDEVVKLASSIGFSPIITGPLKNARYLEAMAHLNIAIAVGQSGGTNAAILYDQRAA